MTRSAVRAKRRIPPTPAILLVDDNADDQLFFQLAWEKCMPGHPLRVVASRKEAMDYLTGQGKFAERKTFPFPSAVVLDMQLPDGTGSELVHWIRSDARFNRMAVIMLSGSARENEIHQAYSNGANSFLLKPANPKELQQTVQLIRSSWFRQDSCQGLVRPQA